MPRNLARLGLSALALLAKYAAGSKQAKDCPADKRKELVNALAE